MACEVDNGYGPINFIENASKLHLRALESWKRGIHTLNERFISMKIERDTLKEQLEAMHAGYKKQLQLKVMKINELQSTISEITKKLDTKASDHVKEEDIDSNDMENGTSLHEEGYDDSYTSDDNSPDLPNADYGDVYLDTCTDEDSFALGKIRQCGLPEGSHGTETNDNLEHLQRTKKFPSGEECHGEQNITPKREDTISAQQSSDKKSSMNNVQEEQHDVTIESFASPSSEDGRVEENLTEEPVVVTVLSDDNGRNDYLQTEENEHDITCEIENRHESNRDTVISPEKIGEGDEFSRHGQEGEEGKEDFTNTLGKNEPPGHQRNHGNLPTDGINKKTNIISKSYPRSQLNLPLGHLQKRSISESELSTVHSFKLPKVQQAMSIFGRSCMPLKGPARRHIAQRPNSYSYSQISKNSPQFDSPFIPTMSNISFHNSPMENGVPSQSKCVSQFGSTSHTLSMKSESTTSPSGTGSISQLASFYQKEFDISKQYKCDFCGSKYTKLASLRRHLRAHTGVKPYKCMSCFKEFTRRDVLKIHMERHKVQNQYNCYICGLKFAYVKDLRKHGLSQHKEYMSVFKESLPPGEKEE